MENGAQLGSRPQALSRRLEQTLALPHRCVIRERSARMFSGHFGRAGPGRTRTAPGSAHTPPPPSLRSEGLGAPKVGDTLLHCVGNRARPESPRRGCSPLRLSSSAATALSTPPDRATTTCRAACISSLPTSHNFCHGFRAAPEVPPQPRRRRRGLAGNVLSRAALRPRPGFPSRGPAHAPCAGTLARARCRGRVLCSRMGSASA